MMLLLRVPGRTGIAEKFHVLGAALACLMLSASALVFVTGSATAAEGQGGGSGVTNVTSPTAGEFPKNPDGSMKGFCDDLILDYRSHPGFTGTYRDGINTYAGPLILTSHAQGYMSPANSYNQDNCATPSGFPATAASQGGQPGQPNSVSCNYEGTYQRQSVTLTVLNLYGECTIWDVAGVGHTSGTHEIRRGTENCANYDAPAGIKPPDECEEDTTFTANSLQCGSLDERNLKVSNPQAIVEGNTGDVEVKVPVSLDGPSCGIANVLFSTENGTATGGSDYEGSTGTLTLLPGESAKDIVIRVKGDTDQEPDETFSVRLSQASGAGLDPGASAATITILNDDSPPAPPPPPPPPPPSGPAELAPGGPPTGNPGVLQAKPPFQPSGGQEVSAVQGSTASGAPAANPIAQAPQPPPPAPPAPPGGAPTGALVPTTVSAQAPGAMMAAAEEESVQSAPQAGAAVFMVWRSDGLPPPEFMFGGLGMLILFGCTLGGRRGALAPGTVVGDKPAAAFAAGIR